MWRVVLFLWFLRVLIFLVCMWFWIWGVGIVWVVFCCWSWWGWRWEIVGWGLILGWGGWCFFVGGGWIWWSCVGLFFWGCKGGGWFCVWGRIWRIGFCEILLWGFEWWFCLLDGSCCFWLWNCWSGFFSCYWSILCW